MKGKNLAVLLVLMLLLGWLVASSVSSFQEIIPGSNSTGTGSSGSGGSSTGTGSGSGLGGSGGGGSGFNFGFPFNLNFSGNFKLPQLNLSLPHFNLTFPNFNFSWFKFPFKFGFFNTSHLGTLGGNGTGGGSSGGGSSGTGTSPTHSNPVSPLKIDPVILIALIVAVAALLSILVVRQVMSQKRDKKGERKEEEEILPGEIAAEENPTETESSEPQHIGPHEKIVAYSGWDPGNGLIGFEIDSKLPLVWQKTRPLKFSLAKGAKLKEPDSPEMDSENSYSYTPVNTCTLFNAKTLTLEDRLWVRAVTFENEVRKLFLLNFGSSVENFKNMTSREIMAKIIAGQKAIKDVKALETLISIYERTFYGKKKPQKPEFETFLLSLHLALEEAKIVICADD